MTSTFRYSLIWSIGSFIAILMSLNTLPASLIDGHYIPVGNDSFYHARRILDAVADPGGFYEFDDRIHAPEGSQLTWPWAYDYLMSKAVRLGLALGLTDSPMTILAYLPVLALPLAIALVIGITRALKLSAYASLLAVLCVALSPLTQLLHGVGIVDHHFVEYIFTLATLWAALNWLNLPNSPARAVICGCVLGAAPAFHNGMFILQIPMIAAFAMYWLRDEQLPIRTVAAFAFALVASTLIVALPSDPFQQGKFEFYLLSWFHVYIAACSAIACLLLMSLKRRPQHALIIAGFAVIALIPIARQAVLGGTFVAGDLDMLRNIAEVKGIGAILATRGPRWIFDYYSMLILLVPFAIAGCLWFASRREASAADIFFCFSCAGGLALLLAQFRMHPYGSFALYLPFIAAADRMIASHPAKMLEWRAALGLLLALAFALPIQDRLFAQQEPANDPYYALTRTAYAELHKLCKQNPGLVLAGSDAGNYVRYHTECSVIANNFLLTPQHAAKIRELNGLLGMTPEKLLQSGQPVRYVLLTLADVITTRGTGHDVVLRTAEDFKHARPALVGALLGASPKSLGPRFKLLIDYKYGGKDGIPIAKLYEVVP